MSKYSRALKITLAQQCLNGVSSPKALGKQLSIPHSQIRYWSKVYSFNGDESFLPPKSPHTAKGKADILKRMWTENWSYITQVPFTIFPLPVRFGYGCVSLTNQDSKAFNLSSEGVLP